jgi:hypothetical protein
LAIVCAIHFTHPSYTDLFDDVVKAEGLANHLEEPARSAILGRTLKQVNVGVSRLPQVSRIKHAAFMRLENLVEIERQWKEERLLILRLAPFDTKLKSPLLAFYLGPRDG